jgi:hypothetical protein
MPYGNYTKKEQGYTPDKDISLLFFINEFAVRANKNNKKTAS